MRGGQGRARARQQDREGRSGDGGRRHGERRSRGLARQHATAGAARHGAEAAEGPRRADGTAGARRSGGAPDKRRGPRTEAWQRGRHGRRASGQTAADKRRSRLALLAHALARGHGARGLDRAHQSARAVEHGHAVAQCAGDVAHRGEGWGSLWRANRGSPCRGAATAARELDQRHASGSGQPPQA